MRIIKLYEEATDQVNDNDDTERGREKRKTSNLLYCGNSYLA
jgi:hypothetical protein